MGKMIDLSNKKFGRLTVIEPTQQRASDGSIIWKCKCDCGNEKIVSSIYLRKGKVKSCGCLYNETRKNNLLGQKFGKLLVIEDAGVDNIQRALWKCKCDCGNEKIILGQSLISGSTKSCGCLNKIGYNIKYKQGDKIGLLTIIEDSGERKGTDVLWKCRCDCGKEIFVTTTYLSSSNYPNCGHLKESQGSILISNLLKENNLFFEKEKSFDDCYFQETKAKARFDFYVENKYLIEFDGEQHFIENKKWDKLENIKKRDEYKNQWCKKNNIPLIRIPYTHLKKLCIEDLQLETSEFII